mgnify:CR=1 FL=1
MKNIGYDDYDLDGFLLQRYPKLTLPVGKTIYGTNNDYIRNEELYDVLPINFNFDHLYLREHQLDDVGVLETIASSCLPFLQHQAAILKDNMAIMGENERYFKELKVMVAELRIIWERILLVGIEPVTSRGHAHPPYLLITRSLKYSSGQQFDSIFTLPVADHCKLELSQ